MCLAGGDPLLYPHLVKLVADIRRRGLKPIINTNGIALTRDPCPDITYWKDDQGREQRVWSCRLEEPMKYGGFLRMEPKAESVPEAAVPEAAEPVLGR